MKGPTVLLFEVKGILSDTKLKNLMLAVLICFNGFLPVLKAGAQVKASGAATVCNPMDLNYRFCLDKPSRREAADPSVINFKGEYFLFASKSGGYWHSDDLKKWDLISSTDLPLEDYAPTAVAIGDTVYFMASSGNHSSKIMKSADPKTGKWSVVNAAFPIRMTDPDLFLDDNGRLYLYYGCSNKDPIRVVELDRRLFMPIGEPIDCFNSNRKEYGWERLGDFNEKPGEPWIEGAWMTKHAGKYYLQYAGPATENKSYCDGMYISDSPVGPFHLAPDNPFSSKPDGFIASAGHSGTFKDNYGNYWRISTMTISVKHRWERRLGLFPAFFGSGENAYAYTGFGDFPIIIPAKKIKSPDEVNSGWMLLSYNKPVEVSSELPGLPANNAVDENIRTWWSAKTGDPGEWLIIDLQKLCRVNAVQVNFADQDTELFGRSPGIYQAYTIAYSDDRKNWKILNDKTAGRTDSPHDYFELPKPVTARYLRITNKHVPGGTFALSDFRVFGNAMAGAPAQVTTLRMIRDVTDPCIVHLKWDKAKGANGYNVRYGISPDRLYHDHPVLRGTDLTIRSLNSRSAYYFTIDSFNGSGIKKGAKAMPVK